MREIISQYLTEAEESLYDGLEQKYAVALERANTDIRAEIEKLDKIISNLGYAIETCDNLGEIPSLRSRLTDREKEKMGLEERLARSIAEDYRKDKEKLVSLSLAIHRFCHDKIDNWELRDLFLSHDIKIFVDKPNKEKAYVSIRSEKNPGLPSLIVSYADWRKKYVAPSLANRPQHFQKGHHYYPPGEFVANKSNGKG